ncbi:hypothetical protein [Methanococcus aeolicus]|jgi:acetyl-CoA carboxylase beta subunit|nr:hypothetical protein [Methanococcus aeolicus]
MMECPYCNKEDCVDEYIIEFYLTTQENFKRRKNTALDGTPVVCEAGICKTTGDKIWFCPHCKSLIKHVDSHRAIVQCPKCHKDIALPATNRTFC